MTHVVAISGSLGNPSRTRSLVELIGQQAAGRLGASYELIDIASFGPALGSAVSFGRLPEPIAAAHRTLASADLIVIGSPVYKASYSGLLKHFFDLLDPAQLRNKVAILAATGGSDRHAMVLEHHLRPLANFFEMHTVPSGVYARDAEFTNYVLDNEATAARVELTVSQALRLLAPVQRIALAA